MQGLRQFAQDGVEENENYCMRSIDQRRFRTSYVKVICQNDEILLIIELKSLFIEHLILHERMVNLENYESQEILIQFPKQLL